MKIKKKFKLIAIVIFLVSTLFFIQFASALTANSSSYSVSMFGTGMASATPSSNNYNSTALTEAKGTARNAKNADYTANIGFFENTIYHVSVTIASYEIYPASAVNGSIIRFSISASNSESVWLVLAPPSGPPETIALINNNYTYYTANLVGIYTATFYANNSEGHIASAISTFEITSPAAPVTPPSGGGGVTVIIEKCSYIWDCTSWSICSDKMQSRECRNIGNCTGTEGKPIESRVCSDALFDVVISLKEVELTKNDTLKFNVSLTETKGIEKIDVQIRYSIIDSNNTEIFSQIETRAIQGNLTFEKEIREMKLANGDYILRVDILYNNLQRAFAEQKFRVAGREIEIKKAPPRLTIFFIIEFIILIAILLLILLIIKRFKKKSSIGQKLERGLGLIAEGKTNEARLIYSDIKQSYNPNKDTDRKMYNRIIGFYNKILESKPSRGFIALISAVFLLFAFLSLSITGSAISNAASKNGGAALILLVIISVLVLLIISRKDVIGLLSGIIGNYRRHPKTSLTGLIGKKVYSESGLCIGKIGDVLLGENRIDSLKIKIDKKRKFKAEGIIMNYKLVKNSGEIMIIEEKIAEHLENFSRANEPPCNKPLQP